MKRTELIALADELECLEREQADAVARSTIRSMVQFARQIAQAQTRAYAMHRNGIVYDILTAREYEEDGLHFGQQSVPPYTLPLED